MDCWEENEVKGLIQIASMVYYAMCVLTSAQYVESVREWSMQLGRSGQNLGIVVVEVGHPQRAMVEEVVVATAVAVDHRGAPSIQAIVALCVENAAIIHMIVLSLVVVVVQALKREGEEFYINFLYFLSLVNWLLVKVWGLGIIMIKIILKNFLAEFLLWFNFHPREASHY